MTVVALVLSLLIAALGALGIVAPGKLIGVVQRFQSPAGLYTAAGIRLLYGAALYLAAPASGSPQVLRGFGVFVFVAGLVTPLIGVERFHGLSEWWASRGAGFVRAWAAFPLLLGLMLAALLLPAIS